ncbi:MAG: cache domain-containing protein, partial [Bacteroidetes bacterium]|nr:cache domain-containing protein [Bacteroidota bacterium]
MKIFEKSLTNKIVFYFFSIIFICVLLISYISYLGAKTSIVQSISNQLVDNLYIKKTDLTHWLNQQIQKIDFISSQKELANQIEKLAMRNINAHESQSFDEVKDYFSVVFSKFSDFKEYELLSPTGGIVILSNKKEYIGEFRANDSYYINAKKKLYVHGVYPSPITSEPTIVIAVPIVKNNRALAILAIRLNLNRVNEIKKINANTYTDVQNYLIDEFNMFMASDKYDLREYPRGVHSFAIDKAIKGANGAGVYNDFQNEKVIGAYTWVSDLKVAIISEIKFSSAIAPAEELARIIILTGFLLSVFAAVFIVYASKKISRPILAIEKTALLVSSGDLT